MSASSPGQTVFSIGYDFHVGNGVSGSDNGNVWGITNYKDSTRNQAFTYDALNRLTSAQNAGTDCTQTVLGNNKKFWGNTYNYDAWGNLTNKTKIAAACAGEGLSVAALVNNQLSGYTYDAAGNMTSDPTDGDTLVYDAENRISTGTRIGVTTSYTYDGDGNRVKKLSGSAGTLYWYMTPGIVGGVRPGGGAEERIRVLRWRAGGAARPGGAHGKTEILRNAQDFVCGLRRPHSGSTSLII